MRGKDAFYLVLALGAGYVLYKLARAAGYIGEGAGRLWEGITFDPASMGPGVQLTPQAQLTRDDYIRLGYLKFNTARGVYEITPEGQAYIDAVNMGPQQPGMSGYVKDVQGVRLR